MEWHSKYQRELESDIALFDIDPLDYEDILDMLFPASPLISAGTLPPRPKVPLYVPTKTPSLRPIPASRMVETQVGYIETQPDGRAYGITLPREYKSDLSLPCSACHRWFKSGCLFERDNGVGVAHTFVPFCVGCESRVTDALPLTVRQINESTYGVFARTPRQT